MLGIEPETSGMQSMCFTPELWSCPKLQFGHGASRVAVSMSTLHASKGLNSTQKINPMKNQLSLNYRMKAAGCWEMEGYEEKMRLHKQEMGNRFLWMGIA